MTPNLAAYSAGRERGLRDYCQPKNGSRAGLNGNGYANVCSGSTETAFVNAYQWGRQIHDARAELRTTNSRLRNAREGLAHTNAAMASVTAELVLPTVPIERRTWLATELVRLDTGAQRTDHPHRSARRALAAIGGQRARTRAPEPLRALNWRRSFAGSIATRWRTAILNCLHDT